MDVDEESEAESDAQSVHGPETTELKPTDHSEDTQDASPIPVIGEPNEDDILLQNNGFDPEMLAQLERKDEFFNMAAGIEDDMELDFHTESDME